MKDALGHGSGSRGASAAMSIVSSRLFRSRAEVASNADAAHALACGPKSAPAPIHSLWSVGPPANSGSSAPKAPSKGTNAWDGFGR